MRISKIVACAILSATVICAPAFAQKAFDIAWKGGRLTVHAANAPLTDVMAEVARQTGILLVGQEKLSGTLSADFADLPAKDALSQLLVDVNYIIQNGNGPKGKPNGPLVVLIHSMSSAASSTQTSGPVLIRQLDLLMTVEANDVADLRQEEEEDDPDAVNDRREDKIRATSMAAMGAFGPAAPTDALIKLMSSVNDEVRLEALKAIGARRMPDVLETLISTLGDEVWEIRNRAVEILGHATDADSLRAVGETLVKNEDRDVQIDALRVLSLRGAPESAEYLRAAQMKNPDASIREVAELMANELDRREQARRHNADR